MFNNKREAIDVKNIDTILGINTVFEGNLKSESTLKVEGELKGDITAKGDIHIGRDAIIKGNITAVNVFLSGSVEGNIRASGVLQLQSTGKLTGDIFVNSFVADEGGIFSGNCSMSNGTSSSKNDFNNKSGKDKNVLEEIYVDKQKHGK